MSQAVPAIYAPQVRASKMSISARALAAGIACACFAVLTIAYRLNPDSAGVGTHTALGLAGCQFLYHTGLPCPSCGMTTSFSQLAHGHILGAFYVQPMGATLALLTMATFWAALYIAITGKPATRLMRLLPARFLVIGLMFLAIAAWGWKIFIHLTGRDGW